MKCHDSRYCLVPFSQCSSISYNQSTMQNSHDLVELHVMLPTIRMCGHLLPQFILCSCTTH